MLRTYRRLFAVPGARAFTVAGLVSRLPIAMLGLAILILVSGLTGSYATAGAVAATVMISFTIGAPFTGRLTDRYGQFRLLIVLSLAHLVGLGGLMVAAELEAPLWVLFVTAAATGASRPPTGSMVRARWAAAFRRSPVEGSRLEAAFAFESIADEAIFIVGPVIIAVLATTVDAFVGIAVCLVLTVGGTIALAVQRGSEPPTQRTTAKTGYPILIPGIVVLTLTVLFMGSGLGSIELITLAHAKAEGVAAAAGPLLAVLAFGGTVGGVFYGARTWRSSLRRRWNVCLILLTAGLLPLTVTSNLWSLGAVLFVAGLVIVPASVIGLALVEKIVPAGQLTEGITWLSTSSALGMAIGNWSAGWLVDTHGAHRSYLYPVACGVLALLVGVSGSRLLTTTIAAEAPVDTDTDTDTDTGAVAAVAEASRS
jgi:MFS family permease